MNYSLYTLWICMFSFSCLIISFKNEIQSPEALCYTADISWSKTFRTEMNGCQDFGFLTEWCARCQVIRFFFFIDFPSREINQQGFYSICYDWTWVAFSRRK